MGEETAFKTFVEEEFETHYVPNAFEEISRQFLIRLNRSGRGMRVRKMDLIDRPC